MKKQTKKCRTCGKVFEKKINCSKYDWTNSVKYCSRSCIHKGKSSWNKGKSWSEDWKTKMSIKLQGRCLNTGRTHIKKGQRLSPKTEFRKGMVGTWKGKKLSKEHIENTRRARTGQPLPSIQGKNHWNWKGGATKPNRLARKSIGFKTWREEVYNRDNFTCQKCKIRGGNLHPHHIENFANNLELRYVLSNGITLHEKCHKEFHKIYGHRNNTREQINSFITTI